MGGLAPISPSVPCVTNQALCLNRTFYGIETQEASLADTFRQTRLNRTFYGIETLLILHAQVGEGVLIVPFMELKHQASGHIS